MTAGRTATGLVEPGEAAAVAELLEEGAGAAAARRWAGDGFVRLWDGAPVVAGASADEVDGAVQLYLPLVARRIRDDADSFAGMLEALLAAWPEAELVVVRLPPGAQPSSDAFRLHSAYLSKRAEAREASDAYEVRPPRSDERPFVHGLLERAILTGYRSTGREPSPEQARRYVRARFRRLSPDGPISSLVALSEGELVGHGTWLHDSVDDVTERSFHELVDVFVLESFRSRGATQAIVGAIETAAAGSGATLLGHVVGEEDGRHRDVAAGLVRGGWQPEYDLWLAPSSRLRRPAAC